MVYSAHWLADVLRARGLQVVETPGWQSRGRGEMGQVDGVMCHDTASSAHSGDHPDVGIVTNGRSDLPGPLAHLLLSRSGVYYVIAAGRCNHAGAGSWQGHSGGNSNFIGIEAENDGLGEPWPDYQMDAYARGVGAILLHVGAPPIMAVGHKEYATPVGRKQDPSFDMNAFRVRVTALMGVTGQIRPASPRPPAQISARPVLRLGAKSEYVRTLQTALGMTGTDVDGIFGKGTEARVKAFQTRQGLTADGIVGDQTWLHLAP